MPRISSLLDSSQISDVIAIDSIDTFYRPIYAGNAIAKIQSTDPVKVLTIRSTCFPPTCYENNLNIITNTFENFNLDHLPIKWVKEEINKNERPTLENASIVVSGGRGLRSKENFKIIYDLADKLKAAGTNVK